MITFFTFIGLLSWFAFWASQAGRSMADINPVLDEWQDSFWNAHRLPELVIALTFASFSIWGITAVTSWVWWVYVIWFALSALVSFGGKESATWAYLNWGGHTFDRNKDGVHNDDDARQSGLWGWNKWLAGLFGVKLGDKAFSWVWAFTKGLIITLPIGGFGCMFLPLSKELAYHVGKRTKLDNHFLMEFLGDGLGYTLSVVAFISVILMVVSVSQ